MQPGWKTSEFWISLITIVGSVIQPFLHLDDSKTATATTIAAVLVALGYTISRTVTKTFGPPIPGVPVPPAAPK